MNSQSCATLYGARGAYRGPEQNHLLAALPATDYERLLPELELVALPLGRALCTPGAESGYAYFPTEGIVSLLAVTNDGLSTETALTGREGVVGIELVLGGATTPLRAAVQSPGNAYRLKAAVFDREFERGGALQRLVLQHTLALTAQIGRTAACNRLHRIEQQLCRSILSRLDRLDSNALTMTHRRLAHNLGVRRECVTQAAARLQRAGVIRYHRAHITVPDRSKLEARACECYAAVRKEYGRLIPVDGFGAGQARRRPSLRFVGGGSTGRPEELRPAC